MKKEVTLYGINEKATFEESDVQPVLIDDGSRYEEAAITDDGRIIAFDEAICEWVQLGMEGDQGYTFYDQEEAEAIAEQIRERGTWDDSLNRQLCKLAGLEGEYDTADGDTFEDIVFRAAKSLGVEIN